MGTGYNYEPVFPFDWKLNRWLKNVWMSVIKNKGSCQKKVLKNSSKFERPSRGIEPLPGDPQSPILTTILRRPAKAN